MVQKKEDVFRWVLAVIIIVAVVIHRTAPDVEIALNSFVVSYWYVVVGMLMMVWYGVTRYQNRRMR